jgi:hypothetical protein
MEKGKLVGVPFEMDMGYPEIDPVSFSREILLPLQ